MKTKKNKSKSKSKSKDKPLKLPKKMTTVKPFPPLILLKGQQRPVLKFDNFTRIDVEKGDDDMVVFTIMDDDKVLMAFSMNFAGVSEKKINTFVDSKMMDFASGTLTNSSKKPLIQYKRQTDESKQDFIRFMLPDRIIQLMNSDEYVLKYSLDQLM